VKKFKNIELTARRLASRVLNEGTEALNAAKKPKYDREDRGGKLSKISIGLMKKAGVPLYEDLSPEEAAVHWDGSGLAVAGLRGTSLIHELAHLQLAPQEWLRTPEYGLGIGPEGNVFKAEKRFGELQPWNANCYVRNEVDEEVRASLLGILWERHFGFNFWDTFAEHCWTGWEEDTGDWNAPGRLVWDHDDCDEPFRWLLKHGYINGAGRPNLVFSDGSNRLNLPPA
jgi:hypothetical protein